jgi:hypothetical protein
VADQILRIGAELDVSSIIDGSKQAAAAMENLGTKVGEASAEMLDKLYPAEKMASEAAEQIAVSTVRATSAMGAARVEMGALEGSTGMMAGGLARVAAQSATLAPLIQAAFVPFAVVAFADILTVAGEKMYDLYQNVFNARDELKAFAEVEKTVDEYTERLAKETEQTYIQYLKLVDPIEAAKEKLRSLGSETFTFKIDDKTMQDLKTVKDDAFIPFAKTLESFPATEIEQKMKLVSGSIASLQAQLGAPVLRGILSRDELETRLRLLEKISAAMDEFQSKQGVQQKAGTAEFGNAQDEAAKKAQEAADAAARKQEEAAYRRFELLNETQEEVSKEAEAELRTIEEGQRKKEEAYAKEHSLMEAESEQRAKMLEGIDAELKKAQEEKDKLAREDIETQQTLNNRIEQMDKERTQKALEESRKREQALAKEFQPINRAFEQMTKSILDGQVRVSEGFRRLGANIVISTIQSIEQATLKWVEHFIIVELLEHSSLARRLATLVAGESIKRSVQAAAATTEASEQAGIGAAAAFASVLAALPFPLNVATAPEVAAAQAAAILAYGLPKAEEGAYVPRDMPIFAHQGEMILPRNISESVKTMADNGGSNGGGDTHIHMHVSAFDGKTVSDFFHSTRGLVAKTLTKAVRNGMRTR